MKKLNYFKTSFNLKKTLKFFVPIALGMVVVLLYYSFFGCPMRVFFGIPCPGCGLTRALEALLHFDFARAFYLNPMIYVFPLMALVIIFSRKLPVKFTNAAFIVLGVLMIAIYAFRIVSGNATVCMDFENGLIYETIEKFK